MRFKTIITLEPGDIVHSDIYDQKGRVVVAGGVELTEKTIDRLNMLGFPGAYIDDELSKDVLIPNMISVALRNEARNCVENGDIDEAIKYAERIINEILANDVKALDLSDLRSYDNYTYAHSVNVAVLSCILGIACALSEQDLEHLVQAALLHDIGKELVPKEIINKPDRLTKEEYQFVKKHPIYGHEMLNRRYGIPVPVKNAVLLHHENVDGTGYPNGLTGDKLSKITKILHVVDVYDALISDRPYKRGYSTKEAVEYLMGGCGIMFDKEIVNVFIKTVPLYPLGSEVLLSNGEHAIIVENKGIHNLRPVVRTIKGFFTIDLASAEHANLVIYTGSEADRQEILLSESKRSSIIEQTQAKNVLLVDDMKANLVLLESILCERYYLTNANNGEEAIELVRSNLNKFDLIIMDIAMPKMSGTEAAKKINAITGNKIPILFVSTKSDTATVLACKELDAAGYILRPYQPVYLLSEMERILYTTEAY